MQLSITIEGHFGLTWPKWQQLTATIEQMGFAGIFRSDHWTQTEPPPMDALEALVSLAYLAGNSQTVHFGTLVAPLSFRDPILLARQAMAIDELSGGRMILGVGAGWMEREHTMFGYPLGDITTRLNRLEEGLAVIAALIRSPEPVTFAGKFYQLNAAQLLPRPQRPTPILIGGNGLKRTLPLVARYANIWNCQMASVEVFTERSRLLDELLVAAGRQPTDVKRTLMLPVLCWHNQDELERMAQGLRNALPMLTQLSTAELLSLLREQFAAITGSPEQVTAQILAFARAGVEEMMCQWVLLDDLLGLETLGNEVLPTIMRA
ncbi:LLM class F420-dependent oxidoreductase [soil metagenome]